MYVRLQKHANERKVHTNGIIYTTTLAQLCVGGKVLVPPASLWNCKGAFLTLLGLETISLTFIFTFGIINA